MRGQNPHGDQNELAVLDRATRWSCYALEMTKTPPGANCTGVQGGAALQPVPAGACDTELGIEV